MFSSEKVIYGSYGLISSGLKSIDGSCGPYIFLKSPYIWVVSQFIFPKGSSYVGRKSVQFLKRALIIWVVSELKFWKGSLYL